MNLKYISKADALLISKKENKIIGNDSLVNYFLCDSYSDFLSIIKSKEKPTYYEYIHSHNNIKLFFDIEIHKSQSSTKKHFEDPLPILDYIHAGLIKYYPAWTFDKIVLTSHNEIKKSFHIIYNITNEFNQTVYFNSHKDLKILYKKMDFNSVQDINDKGKLYNIIDPSVYRNGIFRTIFSTKLDTYRPLIKDDILTTFVGDYEMESFVCYCSRKNHTIVSFDKQDATIENINVAFDERVIDKNDLKIIHKFINKYYGKSKDSIREIFIKEDINSIVVGLKDVFCHFIEDEHNSNHQFIVIDPFSSKQKCHDDLCKNEKYNEIKVNKFPLDLSDLIKKYLVTNEQEIILIDKASQECTDFIKTNFDNQIENVVFDRDNNTFVAPITVNNKVNLTGKCPRCNIQHQINSNGYCLICTQCNSVFPENILIPVSSNYNVLDNFWTQFNIVINNTIINGEESFNCEVDLEKKIFNNNEITNLFNQSIDGHKITKISEILSFVNPNFKYCNLKWYYFNNNIWEEDIESIFMKHCIIDLGEYLNKIYRYYENNSLYKKLRDNIKSLHTKLHKPSFKGDIITEAKMFFMDKNFMYLLNSKKHLVPFNNGVWDLINNEFRTTTKEDYVNLTFKYDYNPDVDTTQVWTFLRQILPNKSILDWVLKKLSECLNGDIPNTHFIMFIGDGANGKSQLLNLMKTTMGELGEKVEVTLLTRKRNNANETNSEKIKLMNKRFAFLSEPEDGEKINIGLLKELTGSEEIVARGLYQDSISFVMETKLFLACNELPEIKGEDTALWRRIRVVDFPSRFVDEPKESEPLEFKIDRTLPSRMREDVTLKQGFVKILLEYYYKDIQEPEEVKCRTNEYRQENNEFEAWMAEHLAISHDNFLKLSDVLELYTGLSKVAPKMSNKYKKEIEKWIKYKYPNEEHLYKYTRHKGNKCGGWVNFTLI